MSLSVKKKPILFNTEMVKAILDGRKTQARIVIPVSPIYWTSPTLLQPDCAVKFNYAAGGCQNHSSTPHFENSKYTFNDILYVKEPCKIMTLKGCHTDKSLILVYKYRNDITNIEYEIKLPDRFYKKDNAVPDWVSWFAKTIIPSGSIKEMARIFLKVTNVRVERLQDIILDDMEKEGFINSTGFYHHDLDNALDWWEQLWNSTAKDGYKWEDNPYVFIYEFERLTNEE